MGKRIGYRKLGEYMNIFELLLPRYKLPSKPKLFESFAGIGCQRMALDKLGIDYEVVGISEIDKYALASYKAMHNECPNLGSITDIKGKDMPKTDIFTYSFPCTDLSKAGQQKGLNTDTRSGLIFEVLRLLHEMQEHNKLPQVLIMENVVDLVQVKFIEQWKEIQFEIEQMGYTNYTFTMNAKNYGVAQNRDRVFMVSILGKYYYEQPKPIPLEKRLKDYLETNVDESYYLSDKMLKAFMSDGTGKYPRKERFLQNINKTNDDIANSITTLAGNRPTDNFIKIPESNNKGYAEATDGDGVYINRPQNKHKSVYKELTPTIKTTENDVGVVVKNLKTDLCNELVSSGTVKGGEIINHSYTNKNKNPDSRIQLKDYIENDNGIMPTLHTRPDTFGVVVSSFTEQQAKMITPDGNVKRYLHSEVVDEFNVGDSADISFPNGYDKGKRTYNGIAPALNLTTTESSLITKLDNLRIRKLTPRECWRLMGIDDSYFDKASQVVSKSQLYKQAGNGIVVDVFAHILKELL
jgi:DNA (cytosine-5)-methyltransferase 1